ncbi:hypothetical protein VUV76_19355 [Bacillus thuringiensis]|nr:hypothetical protein [Bacillus thuringiensis]
MNVNIIYGYKQGLNRVWLKVRIFEKDDVQLHLVEITINAIGKNIGYRSASASIFIDLKSLSIKLFNINI